MLGEVVSLKVWVTEGVARTLKERYEECWGSESWNCQRRELTQRNSKCVCPQGREWFSDDMPRTEVWRREKEAGIVRRKTLGVDERPSASHLMVWEATEIFRKRKWSHLTGCGCVEYGLKKGTDRDRDWIIQLREDGVLMREVSVISAGTRDIPWGYC